MFIKSEKKVDVYNNGEFTIEVSETEDCYEAYIFRNNFGVKNYMFGLPKYQQTKEEAVDLFLYSFDEYAEIYDEDYPC